jgi:hypothetical protein
MRDASQLVDQEDRDDQRVDHADMAEPGELSADGENHRQQEVTGSSNGVDGIAA